MVVRVKLFPAGAGPALFDSDAAGALRAFSVADLQTLLLPGEVLTVRREGIPQTLLRLTGAVANSDSPSPWTDALIRRLPVEGFDAPLQARETLTSSLGRYELELSGNLRPVNRQLAAVATRLSGFVGAMLAAASGPRWTWPTCVAVTNWACWPKACTTCCGGSTTTYAASRSARYRKKTRGTPWATKSCRPCSR